MHDPTLPSSLFNLQWSDGDLRDGQTPHLYSCNGNCNPQTIGACIHRVKNSGHSKERRKNGRFDKGYQLGKYYRRGHFWRSYRMVHLSKVKSYSNPQKQTRAKLTCSGPSLVHDSSRQKSKVMLVTLPHGENFQTIQTSKPTWPPCSKTTKSISSTPKMSTKITTAVVSGQEIKNKQSIFRSNVLYDEGEARSESHHRGSFMSKRPIRHILYIYFRFSLHQRSVRWGWIMDRSDDLHFLGGDFGAINRFIRG